MVNAETRQAFKFFHEHGGYIVGRRAQSALELTRAEHLLAQAQDESVASVEWVDDDEPYDPGDLYTVEQAVAKFESNEWTGPFGCVLRIDGEVVASLWGIVVGQWGTNDPYCRVIAAELASEVEDDLRQALGDARDEAQS